MMTNKMIAREALVFARLDHAERLLLRADELIE